MTVRDTTQTAVSLSLASAGPDTARPLPLFRPNIRSDYTPNTATSRHIDARAEILLAKSPHRCPPSSPCDAL
jgi:hypothetical protein